jgi:hypothetical protein
MSDDHLKAAYQELCHSYRAIDDFRAKLLGFLPLATGTGIFLLLGTLADNAKATPAKEFLPLVGLFGCAITLGLFCYELYGIKKCHALIKAGRQIETTLGLYNGHFLTRPREVVGVINEPFAAGVIYPAVLAAWMYFAGAFAWPQSAPWIAMTIFIGGLALVIVFSLLLKREAPWV